jgi:hypothetical protein
MSHSSTVMNGPAQVGARNTGLGHLAHIVIALLHCATIGQLRQSAGCNGYVEKPIDPDTFVSEIEAICAAHGTPARRE